MPREAPGLSKTCLLSACWKKRCAPGLLCDMEGWGTGPEEGMEGSVGVEGEGQGTQQWPLSSREGPSVKCAFLQFEKVESAQIGVLLSSDCLSYATEKWARQGWDPDIVSSPSERGAKPAAVPNGGIPGQTGCLHGDDAGRRAGSVIRG